MKKEEAIRIHRSNLRELSRRGELTEAQRAITLSQLSRDFIDVNGDMDAEALYRRFSSQFDELGCRDRAFFAKELCSGAVKPRKAPWEGESAAAGSHGRISMVRNKYNESAFEVFSKIIDRPKSVIAPSFAEACEDVFDGRCEFCILPVENSQNGRLFGFYSMMDRYELKICALCETETDGEQENVMYALVGKNLPYRLPKSCLWNFEYSVISDTGSFPSDIITVADVFGAETLKIDSLPVPYDNVQQKYYFTFRISPKAAHALDLYLSEEYAGYTAIGLYPVLKLGS